MKCKIRKLSLNFDIVACIAFTKYINRIFNLINGSFMNANQMQGFIERLVHSIEQEDYSTLRTLYADDVENYVTTKDGKTVLIKGREKYLQAIQRMDFSSVHPSLSLTQVHILNPHQALCMVEVKAQKPNKKLHNFAAYLLTFVNDKIQRCDMVEAMPAHSDFFWNET